MDFDSSEDCIYFCELTRMDKKAAQSSLSHVKLTFDTSNQLIKKERFWKGKLDETIAQTSEEKTFRYIDFPINTPGHLIQDNKGMNQFGGEIPNDFKMPSLKGTVVSYLGKISKEEPSFSWLDFDLHLVCPNFLDLSTPIHLDYTNPSAPIFLNKESIENNEFCDQEAMKNSDSHAIYSKQSFSFKPTNRRDSISQPTEGFYGVPDWDHQPFLPYCPKTHKKMKFVLNTFSVSCELLSKIPSSINQGGDTNLFFGDGNLHIFFQPESKILTYFAQYT